MNQCRWWLFGDDHKLSSSFSKHMLTTLSIPVWTNWFLPTIFNDRFSPNGSKKYTSNTTAEIFWTNSGLLPSWRESTFYHPLEVFQFWYPLSSKSESFPRTFFFAVSSWWRSNTLWKHSSFNEIKGSKFGLLSHSFDEFYRLSFLSIFCTIHSSFYWENRIQKDPFLFCFKWYLLWTYQFILLLFIEPSIHSQTKDHYKQNTIFNIKYFYSWTGDKEEEFFPPIDFLSTLQRAEWVTTSTKVHLLFTERIEWPCRLVARRSTLCWLPLLYLYKMQSRRIIAVTRGYSWPEYNRLYPPTLSTAGQAVVFNSLYSTVIMQIYHCSSIQNNIILFLVLHQKETLNMGRIERFLHSFKKLFSCSIEGLYWEWREVCSWETVADLYYGFEWATKGTVWSCL